LSSRGPPRTWRGLLFTAAASGGHVEVDKCFHGKVSPAIVESFGGPVLSLNSKIYVVSIASRVGTRRRVLFFHKRKAVGDALCGIITSNSTRCASNLNFCQNRTTRRLRSEHRLTHCTVAMSSSDDLKEPLFEKLSATPEPNSTDTASTSKKRKRGVVEQGAKKAAKKIKSKKFTEEEDELDIGAGINRAFSHMDNQLLADHVAQRTRKYESDLSSIELEDKHIPGDFCHTMV